MNVQLSTPEPTASRQPAESSLLARYREFLLSKEVICGCINAALLLTGFIVSLTVTPEAGRRFYLGSALIGGIPLFILTAKALMRRDVTAGFVATTAVIAAMIVGEYSAAALVVFMFAVGDGLENLTVARANNALRELAKLVPPTVTVRRNGRECVIPAEDVELSEIVLVRSGERIGVDGILLSGNGSVNQATITGESMPVEKKPGDEVYAGTLTEVGAFEVRVTHAGKDTTLGHIIKLVEEAQRTQAPVQRIANKYATVLVPVTFSIAVIVYLLSGDIVRSITILVVVCPCALVLATPTAVVAAIGNAARNGVLIKSGAVIEQVGKVTVVALDKTGTLTHGKPVVREIVPVEGTTSDQLLLFAASAERFSEHPIGRAIVRAAHERDLVLLEPSKVAVLPGFGLKAQVGESPVVIGNRGLFAEEGLSWPAEFEEKAKMLETKGQTVISIGINGKVSGAISLADSPKEAAKAAILHLKRLGVQEVIMVTGDNARTAAGIAHELGIEQVVAEVLPQGKLQVIKELQASGKLVAFVGDGVNDAPALATANIGIAMGLSGSDTAMETASICLMADEIERVPQVIDLSRKTLSVIFQNVVFSMGMNVLSVVLGGLGIIGPAVGALMHEISALPVLANSARLISYRQR